MGTLLRFVSPVVLTLFFAAQIQSCALDSLAVGVLADTLSGSGSSTVFTGDDDPVLVADALPFALKFYESIAVELPGHSPIQISTGSMYVMYANAFVAAPAMALGPESFPLRDAGLRRAKKLYLRGLAFVRKGLAVHHQDFLDAFDNQINGGGLESFLKDDVESMYWFAAALLGAASLDVLDAEIGIKLPLLRPLLDRAYQLDPQHGKGSLAELLMVYCLSMPPGAGQDLPAAEAYYQAALGASNGAGASVYVARAETVAIPQQNREMFTELITRALAIDPRIDRSTTLATILAQQRATLLLEKVDELFWDTPGGTE